MSVIPPDHARSEAEFLDDKPALDAAAAIAEAHRCLYCADAPCVKACPTGVDIPGFIRKIGTGNLRGSARTIFASNILGASCARVCPVEVLCVGDCVYNLFGEQPPIQIGRLQRYATEAALDHGWRFFAAGPDTGRRVAVLGGGPASLACAHELRRFGHAVTVFEKRHVLGGLNTWGVAPYKQRADAATVDVAYVLGIGGIEVRTGVEVGKDVSFDEIEADFDAVFVGIGLGADTRLDIPGADLRGVHGAVAWIEQMKLGVVELGEVRSAVVIGGGNTAIDAAREVKGLGVPRVTVVYRGGEEQMSGYAHEWAAAEAEGVVAEWHAVPVALRGDEAGHVRTVRFARTGPDKRPLPGSDVHLDADRVLFAVGQARQGHLLEGLSGIALDGGRVVVAPGGRTGRARWWAGGDAVNGGKEVVNAVADGRDAARSIHAHLTGGTDA